MRTYSQPSRERERAVSLPSEAVPLPLARGSVGRGSSPPSRSDSTGRPTGSIPLLSARSLPFPAGLDLLISSPDPTSVCPSHPIPSCHLLQSVVTCLLQLVEAPGSAGQGPCARSGENWPPG